MMQMPQEYFHILRLIYRIFFYLDIVNIRKWSLNLSTFSATFMLYFDVISTRVTPLFLSNICWTVSIATPTILPSDFRMIGGCVCVCTDNSRKQI